MYKEKLRDLEIKLNSKTNGFDLFKESYSIPAPGSSYGDAGLEAGTNILPPPAEDEIDEGLNLVKKVLFNVGDEIIIQGIPADSAVAFLNGKTGIILAKAAGNPPRYLADINDQNWEVPLEYAKEHKSEETEINEVSPYETADWIQTEIHKKEIKLISEWLKTTPEPYDHFHWDGSDLLVLKEGKVIETIERTVLAQNQVIPEKRQLEENHKYDYGCLMTYIDVPIWNDVMSMIEPDDLYTDEEGFGLEMEPHATLLFGLHHDKINLDDIKKELTGVDQIPANVKGISHFGGDDTNKPYDVVKFDLESDHLNNLNSKLQKFPNTNEFEYHPHMTIAYVKKGLGAKYDGQFPSLPTVLGKHIVYSHPSGQKDRWELPIEADVLNSDVDLMEGLNLMKTTDAPLFATDEEKNDPKLWFTNLVSKMKVTEVVASAIFFHIGYKKYMRYDGNYYLHVDVHRIWKVLEDHFHMTDDEIKTMIGDYIHIFFPGKRINPIISRVSPDDNIILEGLNLQKKIATPIRAGQILKAGELLKCKSGLSGFTIGNTYIIKGATDYHIYLIDDDGGTSAFKYDDDLYDCFDVFAPPINEGLNLQKKPKPARAITRITQIVIPDDARHDGMGTRQIDFPPNKAFDWDVNNIIEDADAWEGLLVKYINLAGNEVIGTLEEFSDVNFMIGSDYLFLLPDGDFNLQPMNAYRMESMEYSDDVIISAEAPEFIERSEFFIKEAGSPVFVVYELTENPNYTTLRKEDYELTDVDILLLIGGKFYQLNDDGTFYAAAVQPGI
jgi:hypothetical protein